MKRWIVGGLLGLVALAAGVLLYPVRVQAQEPPQKTSRTVAVTGVGRVKMQADGARITLGIRAAKSSFTEADSACNKTSTKVVKALEELKLGGLTIKPQPVDAQVTSGGMGGMVGPGPTDKDKDKDKEKSNESFTVIRPLLVVVTADDPAKLQEKVARVLQTALENGVNCGGATSPNYGLGGGIGMGGPPGTSMNTSPKVEFFMRDDAKAHSEALVLGTRAAMVNARTMTGEVKPTVISVSDGTDIPFAYNMQEATQPDGAGEIELVVRVRVICSY